MLLNWEALKEKAGLDKIFSENNMEFVLNRTTTIFDKKTNSTTIKVSFFTAHVVSMKLTGQIRSLRLQNHLTHSFSTRKIAFQLMGLY